MARISISRGDRLRVEQLEERCVLAGLPWPVAAADIVGIAATYGQFDNRLSNPDREGWIHFHEGIDIEVAAGKTVFAIEGGTVIGRAANGNSSDRVSIATTPDRGWNYLHMHPTVADGATVKQGDPIGTVAAFVASVNMPTHLHIDAGGGKDPSDPTWLRPVDDPLALLDLTIIGDKISPTLGAIHFMRGEDGNNIPHALTGGDATSPPSKYKTQQDETRREDHGYFGKQDFSQAWIVGHYAPAETGAKVPVALGGTSNIEVIANATDRIMGGWTVGIRSIEFSAAGQFGGKTIPTVQPFNFVNQFV